MVSPRIMIQVVTLVLLSHVILAERQQAELPSNAVLLELGTTVGPAPTGGQDRETAMVGKRFHDMLLLSQQNREQSRTLLETHAKQKALAQATQQDTASAQAQVQSESSAKGGGDPWWLKDLPWWMPPPPEWGPLPPTMYSAYWERPIGAPLSTPNYGPLFRRVEDMEPPLGHGAALKSSPSSNPQMAMEPPVQVQPMTANFLESKASVRFSQQSLNPTATVAPHLNTDPNYLYGLNPAPLGVSFLEMESKTSAKIRSQAPGKLPARQSFDSLSGPRSMAERLPRFREVTPAPPYLRYDRSLPFRNKVYQKYWSNVYSAPKAFSFKYAPAYPPDFGTVFKHDADWGAVKKTSFYPRWYPSKYDQPTQLQQARLQQIGDEQDALPQTEPMRDPSPPPF